VVVSTVAPRSAVSELSDLLTSPEIEALIAEVDELRWTGRRGYGARALVAACLVKSLYALPTWTKVAALIAEHEALHKVCGGAPSQWALYRFAVKLRTHRPIIAACIDRVATSLAAQLPGMGRDVAIDASDLPAYANGQRYLSKNGPERKRFSDPDASWGHRSAVSTRKGGGFYRYRVHAAVCTRTGLPLAWRVESARVHESNFAPVLMDTARARGFSVETVAMDMGYDVTPVYEACAKGGTVPIIPLRKVRNALPSGAPTCEHGRWTFAGADFKRNAAKWRCPTGECKPKSAWVKADRRHPLVPRDSRRFTELYRGRSAVEREFGRLKNEYALTPLRVRGLAKVELHADLTMLARLSLALARARAIPLAA
jgi:Transposase DDE domain